MSKRLNQKRSVLPDWLSGFSDDDGTEGASTEHYYTHIYIRNMSDKCSIISWEATGSVDCSHGCDTWTEAVHFTVTGVPVKFVRLLMCDGAGIRRCRHEY